MPRVNIYFSEETYEKLREYIKKEHPGHKVQSAIVQKAVNEFLAKNNHNALARGK